MAVSSHLLKLGALAFLFTCALTLQILGCALYDNWWPMLSALLYILLPMPYIFLSPGGASSFFDTGQSELGEVVKFWTGSCAIGLVAIPTILFHAGMIVTSALVMELLALFFLAITTLLSSLVETDDHGWA
eukprot:TRINITY_DN5463_c0_g1_i1.p1 TRINITY_DN5463_c0_g1~~TRINITY_DN5463_c0_g1_i1.p1  ORF type:complete len:131 (-),score=28.97 TRINITY_DN5463_c0_g1_i1:766-1158(-)